MSAKAVSDALKKMFKAKDRSEQLGAANSSDIPDVHVAVDDRILNTDSSDSAASALPPANQRDVLAPNKPSLDLRAFMSGKKKGGPM